MAYLKKWIASLVMPRPEDVLAEEKVVTWYRTTSAKHLLRGLSFLLFWKKQPAIAEQKAELLADIDQALRQLNSQPAAWFAGENQG